MAPEEIIPESSVTVQQLLPAKDALHTLDLDGGISRVRRFAWDGKPLPIPELPMMGEINPDDDAVFADPEGEGVFARIESVTTPAQWYRFEPRTARWQHLPIAPEPPAQAVTITTDRLVARSADGTAVPLEVYHRADLRLDGTNPTLIQAYGSYGLPLLPGFFAPRMAWLEAGGVLAYAHVRGGGEYGEAWHEAAKKAKKQRAVDDFVACTQELFACGYTAPAHLGVLSQSAGAIVASMALLQRPELFGAAIFGSGMLQTLRFEVLRVASRMRSNSERSRRKRTFVGSLPWMRCRT